MVLGIRKSFVLVGFLVIAMIWAVGVLAYVVSRPSMATATTEFYVLTPDKKSKDYPRELAVAERGVVLVGIKNLEGQAVEYWLRVDMGGEETQTLGPIALTHEDSWEGEVAFVPVRAGERQKVEFLLYKGALRTDEKPYRSLFLLVNVR